MLEVIGKANREITIKDCLSMTSGLPYNCDPDQSSKDVAKVFDELDKRLYSDNPMTTLEMVKKLGGCHLAFQPGEQWRYGTSADVLESAIIWMPKLLLNQVVQDSSQQ